MALTPDFGNLLILSDSSITDIVTFHEALRDIEQSDTGMLYPTVHAYKKVDLGGGAYFHDVPFINGWQLKFPTPGNYTVIGNIGATIVPVAGVFVDRTKAAAFATTSSGGSGPSAAEIAAAILALAQITPIHSDVRKANGTAITGSGIPPTYDVTLPPVLNPGDPWRPA